MKEGKNNQGNELSNEEIGQDDGGSGELEEGWKKGF